MYEVCSSADSVVCRTTRNKNSAFHIDERGSSFHEAANDMSLELHSHTHTRTKKNRWLMLLLTEQITATKDTKNRERRHESMKNSHIAGGKDIHYFEMSVRVGVQFDPYAHSFEVNVFRYFVLQYGFRSEFTAIGLVWSLLTKFVSHVSTT